MAPAAALRQEICFREENFGVFTSLTRKSGEFARAEADLENYLRSGDLKSEHGEIGEEWGKTSSNFGDSGLVISKQSQVCQSFGSSLAGDFGPMCC